MMEISKDNIVKFIVELNDDELKSIYKKYSKKSTDANIKKNDDIPDIIVDKTTEKYKIFLKFISEITNKTLKDVTEFIEIDREDIIKDDNKEKLNKREKELFKHFNKVKCGYYRKTDNIVLNCLRGMCKELGLNLVMIKKNKYDTFNGKVYKRSGYYYSIK